MNINATEVSKIAENAFGKDVYPNGCTPFHSSHITIIKLVLIGDSNSSRSNYNGLTL